MSEPEGSEDCQTPWVWSRLRTQALIRELNKYPCLYNKLDIDYTNYAKRDEKLSLILEKLKEIKPDVTLTCIQREIATLDVTLSCIKNKIVALRRQVLAERDKRKKFGKLYRPKLWCYDELSCFVIAEDNLEMESSKFQHTKQSQFQIMVDYLILNKNLAQENSRMQTIYAKGIANQLWKILTDQLNADGPPSRSVDEWKKVWSVYKCNIKDKVRQYNKNIMENGGGPSKIKYFPAMELAVIDLLNLNVTEDTEDNLEMESSKVIPNPDKRGYALKTINDSDKEIVDKYILLGTIVHKWAQRCQKYNFSLTNYAIRRKALDLANIIEIKDFNADSEWIYNFKKRFRIKCPKETSEVILSASTALGTINIYDVAHDLRIQNKFPERVSKIYDEKFKHKHSNQEDQPVKKKRKVESNVIDLTETCEEEVEILSTDSDSTFICNIEFQTSKSQDSNNDCNVTTCPLTEANPTASSLIQLNKKFPMTVLSVSAKSLSSESSSVNNNMILEEEDVVSIQSQEDVASIQSLDEESIISEKNSRENSNNESAEEDIENFLTNYTITLEDIPESFIPSENERVPVMDTSENCKDPQLDTNCEDTDLITLCEVKVMATDISEIINVDEKFTGNKFEETIIDNKNHDVSTNKKFPPIKNCEDALKHLKILEDFALVKSNFRAIHFISNLEDILKKIPET